MKVSAGTIARTIVLGVALLNHVLISVGANPLPFEGETLYQGVSTAITVVVVLVAWWKNNSFTKAAIKADAVLAEEKAGN